MALSTLPTYLNILTPDIAVEFRVYVFGGISSHSLKNFYIFFIPSVRRRAKLVVNIMYSWDILLKTTPIFSNILTRKVINTTM